MPDIDEDSVTYWQIAKPGQWFIGVCSLDANKIRIVPVNVFDSKDGKIKPATLNNTDERAMNRYASGAPGERDGDSLMPPYMTFRQSTHHVALAQRYNMHPDQCWGFSLVKYAPTIAQLKTASNSLNMKPGNDAEKPYSFSHATRIMQNSGPSHGIRPAKAPGSKPMPADKTKKLVQNLNGGKLRITNIAVHGATVGGTNTVASNAIDDHNSSSTSSTAT